MKYADDDYSQGYGLIKEAFRALTNQNILQPYIGENVFRSSNDGDNFGSNMHFIDIRHQKNFGSSQSVK